MSTFQEDLELVVKATGHEKFRELVASDPRWIPVVSKKAAALRGEVAVEPPKVSGGEINVNLHAGGRVTRVQPGSPPGLMRRAMNAAGAMGRVVAAVASGKRVVRSAEEASKNLQICKTNECGYFDGSVCRHIRCGCYGKFKAMLETEHCPDTPPRW